MLFALTFPVIDPVAIAIGPLAIRWYALAYIVGLLLGWRYCLYLARRPAGLIAPLAFDDLFVWIVFGVILGGRLGYVVFYQPDFFLAQPLEVLRLWQGGMSFHGGLAGVILAMILFARRRALRFFVVADVVAGATPIGLFLGRLANFVNGELYGRVSDVPWAMVFPRGGPDPRHPSQLYQAGLEGIALFLLLFALARVPGVRERPGFLSGAFLVGYGLARLIGELFRQPDIQIGFLTGGTTMGQWLSLPMIAFGVLFMARARTVATGA